MLRNYFYIAISVVATVMSQLLMKRGMMMVGEAPASSRELVPYFGRALLQPHVLSGLALAFFGAFAWIALLSRVDVSFAFPFTSLAFVLVAFLSSVFLKEHVSTLRWLGVIVICVGVYLVSRSSR